MNKILAVLHASALVISSFNSYRTSFHNWSQCASNGCDM